MSRRSQAWFVVCASLVLWLAGAAIAAVPATDPDQLLRQADSYRTSNQVEFAAILKRLGDGSLTLTERQHAYLLYLQGFELAYKGEYDNAVRLMNRVIDQSTDPVLRFRAGLSAVNVLGIGAHYEQAFTQLNRLLDELPAVTDNAARLQGLATAAQLYSQAGQYDLALQYSDQLLKERPRGSGACKASSVRSLALYKGGHLELFDQNVPRNIKLCVEAKEPIYSNLVHAYMASSKFE